MDQREEFVRLALRPGANVRELCRRFGISRGNGYKWLDRYLVGGRAELADRSRRPHCSPTRTADAVEAEEFCAFGRAATMPGAGARLRRS